MRCVFSFGRGSGGAAGEKVGTPSAGAAWLSHAHARPRLRDCRLGPLDPGGGGARAGGCRRPAAPAKVGVSIPLFSYLGREDKSDARSVFLLSPGASTCPHPIQSARHRPAASGCGVWAGSGERVGRVLRAKQAREEAPEVLFFFPLPSLRERSPAPPRTLQTRAPPASRRVPGCMPYHLGLAARGKGGGIEAWPRLSLSPFARAR